MLEIHEFNIEREKVKKKKKKWRIEKETKSVVKHYPGGRPNVKKRGLLPRVPARARLIPGRRPL